MVTRKCFTCGVEISQNRFEFIRFCPTCRKKRNKIGAEPKATKAMKGKPNNRPGSDECGTKNWASKQ